MNKQKIFDTVWNGIVSQGGASIDPVTVTCLYRGPNGRKCAAGWMIPNEKEHLIRENCSIQSAWAEIALDMSPNELEYLAILQRIHDDSATHRPEHGPRYAVSDSEFLVSFMSAMRIHAIENGLTPSIQPA